MGSRYNAVAGANWVVGEVTARILANVDGHVNTNWDVGEGTLVEGRVGFEWRFQCFSIMADYVYRSNNESQFRFAIGLLGVGQFGTRRRGRVRPVIPQIDLVRQHAALADELLAATARVLAGSRFILGPEVGRSSRSWPPSAAPATASASTPAPTRCSSP